MSDVRDALEGVIGELEDAVARLEEGVEPGEGASELISRVAALSARIGELVPAAMRARDGAAAGQPSSPEASAGSIESTE